MTDGQRRRHLAVPAAIVLLHIVLAVLAFKPAPHVGGDNAVYLSVARSILEGGYRDLFLPDTPPHVVYPPGFPLITAAGLALGLEPWVGLKMITMFFSGAMVLLAWMYARRDGPRLAVVVAVILAVSPGVLALSHWELSDVPFTAFVIAALIVWRDTAKSTRAVIAASALTVVGYSVRSAGLPLIVAALVWLAMSRRWRQLGIAAAIMLLPAAAWWLYSGGQGGYLDQLLVNDPYVPGSRIAASGLIARVGVNLVDYGKNHIPALMAGLSVSWLVSTLPLIALSLPEWGIRLLSARRTVLEIFVPLYTGMILLWLPQFSADRMILPLYPFLLLYAGLCVVRLGSLVPHRARRVLLAAPVAGFAAVALPGLISITDRGIECTALYRGGDRYPCVSDAWLDFFVMSDLTASRIPRGSVVLSRKPAVLFAASGHRGKLYPYSRDPAVLIDSANAVGARYVLLDYLDALGQRYVVPAVIQRPRAFCVVGALGPNRATLFGILPGAADIPNERDDPGRADVAEEFAECGPEYRAQSHQP